jgi:hypothetical protein
VVHQINFSSQLTFPSFSKGNAIIQRTRTVPEHSHATTTEAFKNALISVTQGKKNINGIWKRVLRKLSEHTKGSTVISLERHSHDGEICDLYVIKKGYCQDSSILEVVIGSITDQDVKTLKTNGKRQFERRSNGKMIHKNISETGCDKGTWMERVQNYFQRWPLVCVVLC